MKAINIIFFSTIGLFLSTASFAGCYNSNNGRTICDATYNIPSGNTQVNVTLSCGGGKKILGYFFNYPSTKPRGYPESGIAPIKTWGKNTGFTNTSWTLYLANGAGSSRPAYPLTIFTVCK